MTLSAVMENRMTRALGGEGGGKYRRDRVEDAKRERERETRGVRGVETGRERMGGGLRV